MKNIILVIFMSAILVGCVYPINRHTAAKYYEQGQKALQRGNLGAAKELFSRSLINARLGNMSPSAEGDILLILAKIHGRLCLHNEAEKLFVAAIGSFEKEKDGINIAYPAKLELAQLLFDIGKYKEAIPLLEMVVTEGKTLFGEIDPVSIAVLLDEVAIAYSQVGLNEKAEEKKQEAKDIRNKYKGIGPTFIKKTYTSYPKTC